MNRLTQLIPLTVVLGASLVAACGPGAREVTDGNPGGSDGDTTGGVDADTGPCRKMDVIFVVDDSGSMSQEQDSLASAFPQFAQVLNDFQTTTGQTLDYRVAVTTTGKTVTYTLKPPGFPQGFPTTDNGDNGAFKNTCNLSRRWIERTDPDAAGKLACRAKVGTSGSSLEMHALTTMLSLKERITDGTNAGFLRDDALLAIVYVTDEDDNSRRDNNFTIQTDSDTSGAFPVSELVTFLDTLKGGRGRWATAVVAGPNDCESSFGTARTATRLKQFVDQANTGNYQNAVFASICEGNISQSLATALNKFQTACENIPPVE